MGFSLIQINSFCFKSRLKVIKFFLFVMKVIVWQRFFDEIRFTIEFPNCEAKKRGPKLPRIKRIDHRIDC